MKTPILTVAIIAFVVGIGAGLVIARNTFAAPNKITDPERQWLQMHVRDAETEVLRDYISLLTQDRSIRGLVASMASWTEPQRAERVQTIWDRNATMVATSLRQLRECEQKYNGAYPGQHRPDPFFSQLQKVLETGETVNAQQPDGAVTQEAARSAAP